MKPAWVTENRVATLKDVAALAGVGMSTASRVISGKGPVSGDAAARVRAADAIAAIDEALGAMAAARNVDEWVRADLRFHLSVLEAGGNELLVPLGALIDRTLEAQLHLNARRAHVYNASLAEHAAVGDAIRAGDADGARRAMAALLAVTRARIEQS